MIFNASRTARIMAVTLPLTSTLSARSNNTTTMTTSSLECRYLPSDVEWPTHEDWSALNLTSGGRLIRGVPLAQACYRPSLDETQCATIRDEWIQVTPYIDDPVNVMQPYWQNDTCSPFPPYASVDGSGSCTLGNLAQYAINVTNAQSVIAGINFVQDKNIRLTIKNTGHDYLGRSTGAASLALWMHNLKEITVLNYTSTNYTGSAVRLGAGVEGQEVTEALSQAGLRTADGSCPTVGMAGGWLQNGGHGPLMAVYGLGADNALEYVVVTADGKHLTASPSNDYADLYWALSGGGSGNYAVVLSATVKAYVDGPVAGASFTFANDRPDAFWAAIQAWIQYLLVLSFFPGLKTVGSITNTSFAMNFATWPDATTDALVSALDPFFQDLAALNITLATNVTNVQPTYLAHYTNFTTTPYTVNETVASRLIPRSIVQDDSSVSALISKMRDVVEGSNGIFNVIAGNVSGSVKPGANAVLPAWRSSLFHMNFGLSFAQDASWEQLSISHDLVAQWQYQFRDLVPDSGSYISEATFSDKAWKHDYFGDNYERLLGIKRKYDPESVFWASVAVGSDDVWEPQEDGRLCHVQQG
uniref:Putative 6-hydroxy-D-nicotine oxidase n=1 Tax=Cladonia uncialis subsp. uncialis TaxID=180999 RepID=A0A1Z1CCG2_CLAUC|nr:putative 6-hydroxy-D-nicotine oxidase [Cladonia uncialis subsp. uncialis]AUW31378.1 putative 6-hydroxy-D-nicotine oxidase [Cladonia uncialis subsp. uncialis]